MISKGIKEEPEKVAMIEKKVKQDLEGVIAVCKPILVFDYKNQQSGANSPSVSALGNCRGWQEIGMAVDSGACDTVTPLWLRSETSFLGWEHQRDGLEYEVANRASIRNGGERRCFLVTRDASGPRRITVQVEDLHKALLSSDWKRTQDTSDISTLEVGACWTSTPGRISHCPTGEPLCHEGMCQVRPRR